MGGDFNDRPMKDLPGFTQDFEFDEIYNTAYSVIYMYRPSNLASVGSSATVLSVSSNGPAQAYRLHRRLLRCCQLVHMIS
jgi:hypothetical protein